MLVVDANVAVAAAMADEGFALFGSEVLVAPCLLWAECRSFIHEAVWRRELTDAEGRTLIDRIDNGPVILRQPAQLAITAWQIAAQLGLAKTYDAEYLALAQVEGCRFVTRDGALLRGAARLGLAVSLEEIRNPPTD